MIREYHLRIAKTARYSVLGALDHGVKDLWIVCHGFGQLSAEFLADFDALAKPGRAIVAPEALSRFYKSQGTVHGPDTPVGATWMTREDRESEIGDYVRYLDDLAAELRPRVAANVLITALGFSQGAATVARWIASGTTPVQRLILWGGLLPPEFTTRESASHLRAQPMIFVCGDSDRYFTESLVQKEIGRYTELGIPIQFISFPGVHVLDTNTLVSIANG